MEDDFAPATEEETDLLVEVEEEETVVGFSVEPGSSRLDDGGGAEGGKGLDLGQPGLDLLGGGLGGGGGLEAVAGRLGTLDVEPSFLMDARRAALSRFRLSSAARRA